MTTALSLRFPADFHFEHTIYSHGWCALFPFLVDRASGTLTRAVGDGASGSGVLRFSLPSQRRPRCELLTRGKPSAARLSAFASAARGILHLDLDLRPFHERMRTEPATEWIARARAGRMLRGETFFEDVVKMILTTNCSWSLTETMNARLVDTFGAEVAVGAKVAVGAEASSGSHLFPTAAAIADSSEDFLRREVRLGYRAPYVLELAHRVATGALDIESYRTADLSANELHRALRDIKGVGEYAASNLLKLLGRFDSLGLDSWCRAKFAELHNGGTVVPDSEIEAYYTRFEEWKGLVMWLDVTRHWYAEKFPF
ncbi:MAG: hypothetical protein KFF77_05145 [Bacteroidetes bacterium]|nr:hypothetical protein [Bacteroidota bacterium]